MRLEDEGRKVRERREIGRRYDMKRSSRDRRKVIGMLISEVEWQRGGRGVGGRGGERERREVWKGRGSIGGEEGGEG